MKIEYTLHVIGDTKELAHVAGNLTKLGYSFSNVGGEYIEVYETDEAKLAQLQASIKSKTS